ncbi:MAG: hypothetical protein M3Q62_00245 [Actinomycetota bacterium]|nr:hypothetical protein [Actinomycetota bacterium]
MADNSFTHLVVVGSSAVGIGAPSGLDVTSERISGFVEDDGRGFEDNGETEGGLGLRSVRERAALLEGTVEVYSSLEGGAGVQVCFPLRNGVG